MERHPHNCARNCYRIDLCENCENLKPVDEMRDEMETAQKLYNKWQNQRK